MAGEASATRHGGCILPEVRSSHQHQLQKFVDLFIVFLHHHFNILGICSDVTSLVPDVSSVCLLSFLRGTSG